MQSKVKGQVRRIINACLLVFIPVAILAAIQGYYWYQAKAGLDKLIAALKPVARIEYTSVEALLFQPISLDSVNIRLPNGSVVMTVDRWSLSLSDWQSYLSIDDVLSSGQLSQPVSMSLKGAKVSLASLIRMSDDSVNEDAPAEFYRSDFSALMCGEQDKRQASDLLSLGYSFISGDVSLALEPSTQNKALHFAIESQWQQFMDVSVDLLLGQPSGVSLRRESLGSSFVQRFDINLQDRGFNNRWNIHCREQSGIDDPQLYWAAYESALTAWWKDLGLSVESGFIQAILKAHMANAKVQFSFEPAKPARLLELTDQTPVNSLLSRSEVRFQVSGDAVELSDQEWTVLQSVYAGDIQNAVHMMVTGEQRPEPELESESVKKEVIPGVIPIQPVLIEKSFKETRFENLSQYLGTTVKIQTRFSGPIDGVLISATDKSINVQRHIEQGRATVPIAKDNIDAIQVYR
jgi:hypothetical protein